jgi:hypothetical protein
MNRPLPLYCLACFLLIVSGITFAEEAAVPTFKTSPQKYTTHNVIGGVVGKPSGAAAVVDELLIGDKTKKKLTFWFYIHGSNFHICSMSGDAEAINPNTYQYREGNCDLRISYLPGKVEIEDIGGNCKLAGHCGFRAHIGKMEFRKSG